ncbi:MAG: hypothetical protein QNJ30_12710 [Kiloniellales bacterium]|nr:hypothetical protein [Kiloniellales bacterium]
MFHLNQSVTWHGYPATIIGKTYGDARLYAIRLDDGSRYADIPERQIEALDNVVALDGLRGHSRREQPRKAG